MRRLSAVIFAAALAQIGVVNADNLFVSNFNPGNPTGGGYISIVFPDSTLGNFKGGLNEPQGLAFDHSGNLFVGLQNAGVIDKITPDGTLTTFASLPFIGLGGLAFDGHENLFAADQFGRVEKIAPDGTATVFATGLGSAQGLAFDAAGNLYVSSGSIGTIYKITQVGTVSNFVTGLSDPLGLAFDTTGNLYVADPGTGLIDKIAADGLATPFASGVSGAFGIAFDTGGNLYVANRIIHGIQKVSPTGTVSTFATEPFQPQPLYIADPSFMLPVPEPASLALLGSALLAIGGYRLLRRRRART
jgi:sugar lactone lactonase YvrE